MTTIPGPQGPPFLRQAPDLIAGAPAFIARRNDGRGAISPGKRGPAHRPLPGHLGRLSTFGRVGAGREREGASVRELRITNYELVYRTGI